MQHGVNIKRVVELEKSDLRSDATIEFKRIVPTVVGIGIVGPKEDG